MKTEIAQEVRQSAIGSRADAILRSCVHCGFCNATCPTYKLLGDELDGPRGRIYLIKQMLEGADVSKQTQLHLDRCLTCRNCETTCPSGVKYSELLTIGRSLINHKVTRNLHQKVQHYLLRKLFLNRPMFSTLLHVGQKLKPLLPHSLQATIPERQQELYFQHTAHARKILLVSGCVQPTLKPNIDTAARIVFDHLGFECITPDNTHCCGSLSHHLNAEEEAFRIIKSNIDHWWPLVEKGSIEAISMTASGCGIAIKEYGQLLQNNPHYAKKAKIISGLYKDPAEILLAEENINQKMIKKLSAISDSNRHTVIAFHPACTFQHGLKLNNMVEPFLRNIGYKIKPFANNHLCCGSAGTYSITQKTISRQLRDRKLRDIVECEPDLIITTNIGCQLHLQSGTDIPVKHWLELVSETC